MRALVLVALILTSWTSFAEDDPKPYVGIDGSVNFADRYTIPKDGEKTNQLRTRLTINGFINLDPKGCYQVRARVNTGDAYTSEYVTSNWDDRNPTKLHISLRNLYVSLSCLSENVKLELGALTPTSGTEYGGVLSLSAAGWVDGARVIITDPDHDREWVFTVGNADQPDKPNVFKRHYGGVNLATATVRQKYAHIGHALENATVFLSTAVHNKNYYTRAGIQAAIQDFGKWLGSDEASLIVGAEALESGKGMVGEMTYSEFDLKKWKFRATATHIRKDPTDELRTSMMLKSYMAYGNNAYFNITRNLDDENRMEWNMMFRIGDAGKMIETGVTKRFCQKNQCVVNR